MEAGFNGMRVLVSGGAGFIGSHLVDRILYSCDVSSLVVVDNLWTGSWTNLSHISDSRVQLVTSNIESFTSPNKFDQIIHLASPASPEKYAVNPVGTITANLLGALNCLNFLQPGGKFCFTSTSEVYGDPEVSPQPESYRGSVDCTGPRSSYDESKRCTESLLFELHRTKGLNIRVARIFNTYGPRSQLNDGRAVPNFIASALRGEPITIYGDGRQTRSWGYVDDVINGLYSFFFDSSISHIGPMNIGNDREISVLDIARFVQSINPVSTIRFADPLPGDPSNRRPDLGLIKRLIPGWSCAVPFEEGVLRTYQWFKVRHAFDERLPKQG